MSALIEAVNVPEYLLEHLRETARREVEFAGSDLGTNTSAEKIAKCEAVIADRHHLAAEGPHGADVLERLLTITVQWDCGSDVEYPLEVGDESWVVVERHLALIRLRDECRTMLGDGATA